MEIQGNKEKGSFDLFDRQERQLYVLIDTAKARSSDYIMAQHRTMLKVTIIIDLFIISLYLSHQIR